MCGAVGFLPDFNDISQWNSINNMYEGLIQHPLMTVKKSHENSRALALNEKVSENYSLNSTSKF
jgi:NAD kinase